MAIIIYFIYALFLLLFLWANFLAQGKVRQVLHISFQILQAICAILLFALIILILFSKLYLLLSFTILNLIILAMFYLQPTPRISKYLLYFFLVVNLTFIIINVIW